MDQDLHCVWYKSQFYSGKTLRDRVFKKMINELILFLKQNIHKNVIQIILITDKIVRIVIFISKPNFTTYMNNSIMKRGAPPLLY